MADPKYLAALRARLVTEAKYGPAHVEAIAARIVEVEARIAELPAELPIEVRDEIAMCEGQVQVHRQIGDYDAGYKWAARAAGLIAGAEAA